MSLNPLDIASSFFEMGENKSRVLFRGRARVFFALMEGTSAQTTYRDVGLLSELVVRAETVVRRDALFREQPRAVDVEVRIVLLQNSPVERGVLALCNQLCKCKIRFEVDAANENLIEREEIDFENIFLLPSDEIGIDYETRIGFRFVERMSWRKYLEKFQYGSRPSITLLTPSDNAAAINSSVVFSWNAVATFLDYTLEVSTNATFTTLVHTSTATTTSRTVVLENGWRYWWRVVATNSSETLVSSIRTFTTRLTAPTLTGFPSSIEVPTNSFFQGTAARGAANTLATEVEFEWQVGATPQSNVSVFYNTSGNATGTFNLPSITAPTLIKVRARSKNANVVGEWSDEIDIALTLFRPSPTFTSFNTSTTVVALQADPTEVVRFNLIAEYPPDQFGGTLSFRIVRTDTNAVLGSGTTTVNPSAPTPITLTASFDITNTVTSQSPIQFKAVITRPDSVEFDSNTITVSFVPRPNIEQARLFFNPNDTTRLSSDHLSSQPVFDGSAVARWRSAPISTVSVEVDVEQVNAGLRPTYQKVLSANVPTQRFIISSINTKDMGLMGISTQNFLPSSANRDKVTFIFVARFTVLGGHFFVSFLGGQAIRVGASDGREYHFTANSSMFISTSGNPSPLQQMATSALSVIAFTFTRNQAGNGLKVFFSRPIPANSNNRLTPVQQQGTNNNDYANNQTTGAIHSMVFLAGVGAQRQLGHFVMLQNVDLSDNLSELEAWFDWFNSIYKL